MELKSKSWTQGYKNLQIQNEIILLSISVHMGKGKLNLSIADAVGKNSLARPDQRIT